MATAYSRRHLLGMAAALGSFALPGSRAFAAADRIEQFDPALKKILSPSQRLREIASGFGGADGPAEGPVWWKEGGYLLFSDLHNNRRMKYVPGKGVSVALEPTNRANGLTRDLQGRLIACERGDVAKQVTRREADGSVTIVAGAFQGKTFLGPNDVIVRSDGSIYFSDLSFFAPTPTQVQKHAVYRVAPDLSSVDLVSDDFVTPNGLAFSPDEQRLYVADSRAYNIRVFDMKADGQVADRKGRVFADMKGEEPGVADGIKVDSRGNVYSGGPGGLYIMDQQGKKLGRIVHGHSNTTNMAFGGADWKTLYFTTRSTLFALDLKVAGTPVPVRR